MNRLQERRLELGLSQPDVSAKLKEIDPRMDVGMVSRFERGACLPTLPVLIGLETILQAPRTALFGEDELGAAQEFKVVEGQETSPVTERLASLVPFGRHNAISRRVLAAKLGMNDRQMRHAIEDARGEGLIILCECNGRGYYQSNDLDEIYRQYIQDTNRAMAILKRRRPMRNLLKQAGRCV
ncbi:MAG: helix-turn-helix transcriptional regulator [Oscillospiraceae bacterium]|nr:helix-turn-helix transcriptional regulator [Oscillospiraceae bacterium]